MRILDLGCGQGQSLANWGVTEWDEVTGIDINDSRLQAARLRFPGRTYVHGSGEKLPFEDQRFERVISAVALPYMNIPQALAEVHRVLVPGGQLSLSLHPFSFTWSELWNNAFPLPVPTIFRLYVIANGLGFHLTGRTLGFVNNRVESFQTERGIRIALYRAGFGAATFKRASGPAGRMLLVETRRKVSENARPYDVLTDPETAHMISQQRMSEPASSLNS